MRFARSDRSLLSDWWFTVDRLLFSAVVVLMAGGVILSLAASPSVAGRLDLDTFHFFKRHAAMIAPALAVLVVSSMFTPRMIRRFSLALFVVCLALMVVTIWLGVEIKGATRWLLLGGVSIQPSEFAKPAFVVVSAWLFSETQQRDDVPSIPMAVFCYVLFVALLVMQPDFGQALLVSLVWGSLFFLAGMSVVWVGLLVAGLLIAGVAAYFTVPHVTERFDRFFAPSSGDTYQTDRAIEAFRNGGWFGTGPGEGTVKHVLPDSHADFVFAVVAEEFGLITCLAIVVVFAFIVLRAMVRVHGETDGFIRIATIGLVSLFGLQALINMAVNVGMLPAKGMTLPFISYGGSSLLSMALTMGFVLGLTRRRPRAERFTRVSDSVADTSQEAKA
ncbi:MAG: putative lipid II flippase FtsW [Hyphomicrobiaceae bacterium]|nr:putative lipid II flippase FtsW [Hyphomicrobiaceae bacterium]